MYSGFTGRSHTDVDGRAPRADGSGDPRALCGGACPSTRPRISGSGPIIINNNSSGTQLGSGSFQEGGAQGRVRRLAPLPPNQSSVRSYAWAVLCARRIQGRQRDRNDAFVVFPARRLRAGMPLRFYRFAAGGHHRDTSRKFKHDDRCFRGRRPLDGYSRLPGTRSGLREILARVVRLRQQSGLPIRRNRRQIHRRRLDGTVLAPPVALENHAFSRRAGRRWRSRRGPVISPTRSPAATASMSDRDQAQPGRSVAGESVPGAGLHRDRPAGQDGCGWNRWLPRTGVMLNRRPLVEPVAELGAAGGRHQSGAGSLSRRADSWRSRNTPPALNAWTPHWWAVNTAAVGTAGRRGRGTRSVWGAGGPPNRGAG